MGGPHGLLWKLVFLNHCIKSTSDVYILGWILYFAPRGIELIRFMHARLGPVIEQTVIPVLYPVGLNSCDKARLLTIHEIAHMAGAGHLLSKSCRSLVNVQSSALVLFPVNSLWCTNLVYIVHNIVYYL